MKKLALVFVLMLLARPAFAQITVEDIEEMSKWMEYEIVHYKVVGDFSGSMIILKGNPNKSGFATFGDFTDRIEIEFDWNQREHTLVGKPVIRNFSTTLIAARTENNCQSKVDGALEVGTGLALTTDQMSALGYLQLELRQDQPGGAYLLMGDGGPKVCGGVWEKATPASSTSTLVVWAVPGTFLFSGAAAGMKVTADKKSIVIPPDMAGPTRNPGWTWTITPTGVK